MAVLTIDGYLASVGSHNDNDRDVISVDLRDGETLTLDHNLPGNWIRSEEHTSELQSLMRIPYALFCLTIKHSSTYILSSILYVNHTSSLPSIQLNSYTL